MFALLADGPQPPNPALVRSVEVAFPGGRVVRVPGPEPMADFPASPAQTLLSPRGDAAAARFCWDLPKYGSCQVRLVRPSGAVQVLKNSNVRRLLWTPDGQYLIGAGVNTVRLWNLVGRVRTAVPTPGEVYPQPFRRLSRIAGLSLWGRDLCVQTEDQWFTPTGQQAGRSISATRYTLPTLRSLQVLSFVAAEGQQAPCALPVTEP
ncbi:hypothetical protein F8S09_02115 [Deinococcus sp. SDU3-2]|uniref:WD40 repeat domain-containing protein n=1 Tax=Deinococcus terrestris TaxID=2651870 RepID=A0A7X1TQ89_9DEIO|nr:hypothetical protein [Deinococcus terrestris]MPY65488.1 hypothetical protein [Deinococcus terrestris]